MGVKGFHLNSELNYDWKMIDSHFLVTLGPKLTRFDLDYLLLLPKVCPFDCETCDSFGGCLSCRSDDEILMNSRCV